MTTIRWLIRKARCKQQTRMLTVDKVLENKEWISTINLGYQTAASAAFIYRASWCSNVVTNFIIFMHNMRSKGKSSTMMQRMGRSPINFKDPTSPAHVCSLIVITFFFLCLCLLFLLSLWNMLYILEAFRLFTQQSQDTNVLVLAFVIRKL